MQVEERQGCQIEEWREEHEVIDEIAFCPDCHAETQFDDNGCPEYCSNCKFDMAVDAAGDAVEDGTGYHPTDDRNYPPGWRH